MELSYVQKVSSSSIVKTAEIIGQQVTDLQGEQLGKVDEIILDKNSGKVRYVIIASGGFMGIGTDLHAVPWTALEYKAEHGSFNLNIGKSNLKEAPGFNKDSWPDFSNAEYANLLDNYYTPVFRHGSITETTVDPRSSTNSDSKNPAL